MRVIYTSLLVVLFDGSRCNAFCTSRNKLKNCHGVISSSPSSVITALRSSKESSDDDGGGWFDDYDEFVSKLDFEGGGWDSGADAPFESSDRGRGGGRGGGYSRGGRGGGRGGRGGGYGRGGQSRGRGDWGSKGHDYERDSSDSSSVDETAVNELLASRLQYRLNRDFAEADNVRDELLNVHGVTVWDKDRMWTTQRRDSRGGRGGGRGGGRFDNGRSGRGSGRGRGRDRQFNQFGHDYSQTGGPIDSNTCTLPEEQIHAMIKERMECKFARDFRNADRIEEELSNAGVSVNDGFKEWRADGEWWGRSNRRDRGGFEERGPRPPKVYFQRGPGEGLSDDQIQEIDALVAERSEAKAAVDYDRADEIFDRLANQYNVNVNDKKGEWALITEEYLLNSEETAFVPEPDVRAAIVTKLGERILARKTRNFDLADNIREDLRRDYMVEIDDQNREWVVVAPEGARWSDDDEEVDDESLLNIVSEEEWNAHDDEDEEIDDEDSFEVDDDSNTIEATDDADVSTSSTSSSLDESELSKLTVPQLKEKLREAGLPVSGRKSELIERLRD